mmetsp:Transcript_20990/g.21372  ORF Transcript_20990/g.21372 Transcript_20990/m.21372 type:complete len:176 (-) Transcript_20990:219-746(-)
MPQVEISSAHQQSRVPKSQKACLGELKKGNNECKKKPVPHEWCSPSKEERRKRIIHGKPYIWNNNGSWKDNNTPFSCLTTPSNTAAAVAIASTAIASTEQKTVGVALTAAAATAKAIKLPTTIGDNAGIDDNGTAVTEITQDQVSKIYRIQENLDNYATSINGMFSFLQKIGLKG